MTATGIRTFDHSLSTTKEWLKEVKGELSLADQEQAFEAARAVLHTLRDRLTIDESTDFAAQLPLLLQGLYYHEWTVRDKPVKMRSREEFLQAVADRLMGKYPPEDAVKAVFKVIERHVTEGEVNDVKSNLPDEIKTLWPE